MALWVWHKHLFYEEWELQGTHVNKLKEDKDFKWSQNPPPQIHPKDFQHEGETKTQSSAPSGFFLRGLRRCPYEKCSSKQDNGPDRALRTFYFSATKTELRKSSVCCVTSSEGMKETQECTKRVQTSSDERDAQTFLLMTCWTWLFFNLC